MKTIYISGKIAGCDRAKVFVKFCTAQDFLDKRFRVRDGRSFLHPTIINPYGIPEIPNGSWQDYIERDLIYLKHCDAIYMLKDWKDSAGARIEHEFAKKLGLEIIYEKNE